MYLLICFYNLKEIDSSQETPFVSWSQPVHHRFITLKLRLHVLAGKTEVEVHVGNKETQWIYTSSLCCSVFSPPPPVGVSRSLFICVSVLSCQNHRPNRCNAGDVWNTRHEFTRWTPAARQTRLIAPLVFSPLFHFLFIKGEKNQSSWQRWREEEGEEKKVRWGGTGVSRVAKRKNKKEKNLRLSVEKLGHSGQLKEKRQLADSGQIGCGAAKCDKCLLVTQSHPVSITTSKWPASICSQHKTSPMTPLCELVPGFVLFSTRENWFVNSCCMSTEAPEIQSNGSKLHRIIDISPLNVTLCFPIKIPQLFTD